MALTDSEKYANSWVQAAESFKAAVTADQWVSALKMVRTPLGKLLSRELKSATYTRDLPNSPAGEYVVLEYESSFEHKASAQELVIPRLEKDGKWRVSGYFIK